MMGIGAQGRRREPRGGHRGDVVADALEQAGEQDAVRKVIFDDERRCDGPGGP
jgi:hypothetical protein